MRPELVTSGRATKKSWWFVFMSGAGYCADPARRAFSKMPRCSFAPQATAVALKTYRHRTRNTYPPTPNKALLSPSREAAYVCNRVQAATNKTKLCCGCANSGSPTHGDFWWKKGVLALPRAHLGRPLAAVQRAIISTLRALASRCGNERARTTGLGLEKTRSHRSSFIGQCTVD